jgi:hypothetical protein
LNISKDISRETFFDSLDIDEEERENVENETNTHIPDHWFDIFVTLNHSYGSSFPRTGIVTTSKHLIYKVKDFADNQVLGKRRRLGRFNVSKHIITEIIKLIKENTSNEDVAHYVETMIADILREDIQCTSMSKILVQKIAKGFSVSKTKFSYVSWY